MRRLPVWRSPSLHRQIPLDDPKLKWAGRSTATKRVAIHSSGVRVLEVTSRCRYSKTVAQFHTILLLRYVVQGDASFHRPALDLTHWCVLVRHKVEPGLAGPCGFLDGGMHGRNLHSKRNDRKFNMTTIEYDRLYIRGDWVSPSDASVIEVRSPATEEYVGQVPNGVNADIDRAVDAARAAFDDPKGWSKWAPEERAKTLLRFASALESRGAEMARRVTIQNGMPIWLSEAWEANNPATLLRYYSDLIVHQDDELRQGIKGKQTLVTREPLGVVAAIVPWNVPQGITFLKLAPALAAG